MPPHWIVGQDGEAELVAIYERHYSCRRYADGRRRRKFVGPGECIVLTTPCRNALFVWRRFIDDCIDPRTGERQNGVCCAVFRNETRILSSLLIRQADAIADYCWPGKRHYTYVRPEAVASRNPGWCFICAGWKRCGSTKSGLTVFERLGASHAT